MSYSPLRHGESYHNPNGITKEYKAWMQMRARCYGTYHNRFHLYGGRGIKVCKRWDRYENFLADMGRKPNNDYSLDRINNDGNYKPSNCRWATRSQQMQNRRPFKHYKNREETV